MLHLNTLDWTKWDETVKQDEWADTYGDRWRRLRRLRAGTKNADYRQFGFDVLMANPPFARDIKQSDMRIRVNYFRKVATLPRERSWTKPWLREPTTTRSATLPLATDTSSSAGTPLALTEIETSRPASRNGPARPSSHDLYSSS